MTVENKELSRNSLRLHPFGTPTEMPADKNWHEWQLEKEKKVSLNKADKKAPCIQDKDYSVAQVNKMSK